MDLENKASFILQAINLDTEAWNYCLWTESTLWENFVFCSVMKWCKYHQWAYGVLHRDVCESLHVLSLKKNHKSLRFLLFKYLGLQNLLESAVTIWLVKSGYKPLFYLFMKNMVMILCLRLMSSEDLCLLRTYVFWGLLSPEDCCLLRTVVSWGLLSPEGCCLLRTNVSLGLMSP